MKIVIACSTGGHYVQAERLAVIYSQYDYTYLTFKGGVADELAKTHKVVAIPNINRKSIISVLRTFVYSIRAICITRPDVVISTGAGIVIIYCLMAKLSGAKLVYLESMARIKSPTITARILYPFSDLFIVQWENLIVFFPKAKYFGRLL
ncbi:MAG: beta-1,4-N-acetylglucosaminyltransferase [Colwellia sp.]|jgi:beta-1,4-N-acetylglucosaminyltransferase